MNVLDAIVTSPKSVIQIMTLLIIQSYGLLFL